MNYQPLNERGGQRSTCHLCGADGPILYRAVADRLFGSPGLWDFRQCGNKQCQLVWLDPMPDKAQLERAYAGYYTHDEGDSAGRAVSMRARVMRLLLRVYTFAVGSTLLRQDIHDAERLYLGGVTPGRLLEVGCGNGTHMLRMKSLGWEVEGQEVDISAAEAAARRVGVIVHYGELENLEIRDATYDAIIMVHVIEHVRDPVKLLRVCKRLLKFGGALVVATPNIESFGHKEFGKDWRDIDAPRHLHIFSKAALARLAAEAGFADYTVRTTGAHAQFSAGSSLAIQSREKLITPGTVGLSVACRAVWFQLREAVRLLKDSDCGEECVLVARAK